MPNPLVNVIDPSFNVSHFCLLLSNGSLTGGKISKLSNVPHGRTYEVLQSLVEKGLVEYVPVKPKLFSAAAPKTAFRNYMDRQISALNNLRDELSVELAQMAKSPMNETTREKIKLIWGTRNIRPLLDNKYIEARKYIKMMFTYEYISQSSLRLIEQCLKKGVKVYRLATKLTKDGIKYMKADIARGCYVKYYPVDELRIEITDGKNCSLHVVNPKDSMDRTFIQVESRELTKALEHYFDVIWKKAKPIR